MAQPAAASIARAMQDQRGRVSTRASCACRAWACGHSRWMREIKIRCSLGRIQRACTSSRVELKLRLILFVRLSRKFIARMGNCTRLDTLSGRRVNSETSGHAIGDSRTKRETTGTTENETINLLSNSFTLASQTFQSDLSPNVNRL